MERTKTWRAAYGRRRVARTKLALVQARFHGDLDLATGLKRNEVVRLAQLKVYLQDALFATVNRTNKVAIETEFDYVIAEAGASVGEAGSTREFQEELGDLMTEAIEARTAWRASIVDDSPAQPDEVNDDE